MGFIQILLHFGYNQPVSPTGSSVQATQPIPMEPITTMQRLASPQKIAPTPLNSCV